MQQNDEEKEEVDVFLEEINSKEERIKFTIEKEKNGCIAFLDLDIRRDGNKVITKVFRKSTHTQKYLDWRSNHPKNVMSGVLKTLLHRAHLLRYFKPSFH